MKSARVHRRAVKALVGGTGEQPVEGVKQFWFYKCEGKSQAGLTTRNQSKAAHNTLRGERSWHS
jgi:hypothetical protein